VKWGKFFRTSECICTRSGTSSNTEKVNIETFIVLKSVRRRGSGFLFEGAGSSSKIMPFHRVFTHRTKDKKKDPMDIFYGKRGRGEM